MAAGMGPGTEGESENRGRASSRKENAGTAEESTTAKDAGTVGDGGWKASLKSGRGALSNSGTLLGCAEEVCANSVMGLAGGYAGEGSVPASLKIGWASCKKENTGLPEDVCAGTELADAPGTAGGAACTGVETGETEAGPALAGMPGKCGSAGKESSGAEAGGVTGADGSAWRLVVSVGAGA